MNRIEVGSIVRWIFDGITYQGSVMWIDSLGLGVRIGDMIFTPSANATILVVR